MNDVEFVAALALHTKAAHRTQEERHAAEFKAMCDDFAAQIEELTKQIAAIPAGRDGKDGEPGAPGEGIVGPIGPPGPRGESSDGKDGRDGRDGKDGIASLDEIKSIASKAVDDRLEVEVQKRVAEVVGALPTLQYRGVFQEGTEYRAGQCATWAGSLWHANEPTTDKPGGGSKAWTLAVKCGRDGKSAK